MSRAVEEAPLVEQNPQQSPSTPPQSCLACQLQRTGKREELSPVALPGSLGLHQSYKTDIVVSLKNLILFFKHSEDIVDGAKCEMEILICLNSV